MKNKIFAQFGKPKGFIGNIVGFVLAMENKERNSIAVDKLNIKPGDKILEIGFGPGLSIEKMFGKSEDIFVAGIDHSDVMVKQARTRNKKYVNNGSTLIQERTVEKIPFEDEYFDKVLGINVSLFFSNPVENFVELKRVLKPGGVLQIVFQPRMAKTKNEVIIKAARLEKQVEQAGFKDINTEIEMMKPIDCIFLRATKLNGV